MFPLENFFVLAAKKNINDVVDADAKAAGLINAKNAGHKFLSGKGAVKRLLWVAAVVAVTTIPFCPLLRKIAQQHLAAAFRGLRVVNHLT